MTKLSNLGEFTPDVLYYIPEVKRDELKLAIIKYDKPSIIKILSTWDKKQQWVRINTILLEFANSLINKEWLPYIGGVQNTEVTEIDINTYSLGIDNTLKIMFKNKCDRDFMFFAIYDDIINLSFAVHNGADIKKYGIIALRLTVMLRIHRMAAFLLEAGVNPNCFDGKLINIATSNNDYKMTKILMAYKVKITQEAIDYVLMKGDKKMIELFIKNGYKFPDNVLETNINLLNAIYFINLGYTIKLSAIINLDTIFSYSYNRLLNDVELEEWELILMHAVVCDIEY